MGYTDPGGGLAGPRLACKALHGVERAEAGKLLIEVAVDAVVRLGLGGAGGRACREAGARLQSRCRLRNHPPGAVEEHWS